MFVRIEIYAEVDDWDGSILDCLNTLKDAPIFSWEDEILTKEELAYLKQSLDFNKCYLTNQILKKLNIQI